MENNNYPVILVKYCLDNYWTSSKIINQDKPRENIIEYIKLLSKTNEQVYIEVHRYKKKPFYIKQQNYIDSKVFIDDEDIMTIKK
jgi:hypothetical protein